MKHFTKYLLADDVEYCYKTNLLGNLLQLPLRKF